MFHFNNIYYFIDSFNRKEILRLPKKINIIYRNYSAKISEKVIKEIKYLCKRNRSKFYVADNIGIALKFRLDGIYLPAFNKNFKAKYFKMNNFEILGSAHNFKEIKIKEKQGVSKLFIAPIFKVKKKNYHLNIIKFNLLSRNTKKELIALGGINKMNIKKLKLLNCSGFGSISYLKEIFING